jgi:glycerol-3-phosphate dehydrogenase subunit B
MGPPSLPGIRLEGLFRTALEDAGVTVVGNAVVDFEHADDRLTSVAVARNGQHVPHAAAAFVLATGGLVGTGLEADRERVSEPVFDCHVSHPSDRAAWVADDRAASQPYSRFGLAVDDTLRPLTATGTVEFRNLRAAGSVLGGFDFAGSCSGTGISLATGELAGREAGVAVT